MSNGNSDVCLRKHWQYNNPINSKQGARGDSWGYMPSIDCSLRRSSKHSSDSVAQIKMRLPPQQTRMFLLKQAVWHVLHRLSFIPTIPLSASFPALCPTACFILSLAPFLSFSHHLALLFELLQVLCELNADIDHHVLSDQLPLARIVVHLIQDVQKGLVIGEP